VQIDVFTLFPSWFDWFRGQRHVANALELGSSLDCVDYRASTPLKAGQVDDTPFGGGAGMVLRVDVVEAALRARYGEDPVDVRSSRRVIALTPGGRILDDAVVSELAAEESLTLLCGRYEGFDERIVDHFCTESLSIGRYVVAGGELAAMVVCDAVLRKLPGALGHEESAHEESFSAALGGLPEYPHYTRPATHRGWAVPDVLLSGHHAQIEAWRRDNKWTAREIHLELARHGQAGGLMMEPHPGVFVSTVRTGEWEPDPEVPGSEMHELVHADGGVGRPDPVHFCRRPQPVDTVPARDDPRAPGRGGHRDRRRPDADAQAWRPGFPAGGP